MIEALEDSSQFYHAAEALGQIGDPRAVEPLIAKLQDKEHDSRYVAAQALGMIKDRRAVEPLIAALREGVSGGHGKSSDDRQATGLHLLGIMAAEALGRIKDPRAVEPLIVVLKEGDPSFRRYAAQALGHIQDARAIEPLVAVLKDREPWVCLTAARALNELKYQPATPQENAELSIAAGNWAEAAKIGTRPSSR